VSETWKGIPGWPEYEVSDAGRVRRVGMAVGARAGRVLKPWITLGYPYVSLWRGNKKTTTPVHRLVALAFLPAPEVGQYQVAHGNGVRHDNRPENLRWATPVDNASDRDAQGTGAKGERNPGAKITEGDVRRIRTSRAAGVMVKDIAARYGLSPGYIWSIVHRKRWAHLELDP
jgi:hypothetical protein